MKHETVDPGEQPVESGRAWPSIKLIALAVVVAALAVFFFQNGDDAPVEFLWLDGEWPMWTVIGVAVIAGALIDRLGTWQWRRARRRKQRSEG